MADLLCWAIKPHTFYLLISALTLRSVFSWETSVLELLNRFPDTLTLTTRSILDAFLLLSWVAEVLIISGFIIYILRDDHKHFVQRLSANINILWLVFGIALPFILQAEKSHHRMKLLPFEPEGEPINGIPQIIRNGDIWGYDFAIYPLGDLFFRAIWLAVLFVWNIRMRRVVSEPDLLVITDTRNGLIAVATVPGKHGDIRGTDVVVVDKI